MIRQVYGDGATRTHLTARKLLERAGKKASGGKDA
jgi:hypothetical protein